nr:PREDICTED: neutral cholesterol ester hydrolase 1 [Latimeria chalumnae]|eukprot:XP_014346924.1 PREDICTED: neutral cholesterol ester hydrolase 1 [Latimeria chalumnae]
MRCSLALVALCTALAAYYVYIPLPSSLSEPWKLMLLDATFRAAQHLGYLAHGLGISHHLKVLNYVITSFEMLEPKSSESVQVTDTTFDQVQVRVFEARPKSDAELRRAVVYVHGGGWALASARMRSYDYLCRKMAEDMNAVIVSIERVTQQPIPHSVFPEKSSAVSLTQDSTVTTKLKIQALIYPVLQALDFNTPSYQQNMDIPILYRPVMARFWLEYLNGDPSFVQPMLVNNHTALDLSQAVLVRARLNLNWTSLLPPSFKGNYKPVLQTVGNPHVLQEVPALLDVRAAPLIAEKEVLHLLPKTYILTCEHDVLRDDGIMYAKRLEAAGVEVTHDHYEDGFHGCMIFGIWPIYFTVGARTTENYIKWLDQNL